MLADPRRAAHRTQPPPLRVRFHRRVPGPVSGYSSALPRSIAPLPRVLRDNGYVTGGFGKWHLTPDNVQGAAGPFDRWPHGWGFDHWWGFLSGAAGQYDPIITQDNGVLGVPTEGRDGRPYYFPDDLTDKAVEWLNAVRAQDPAKPWMMYYSTGATHAPTTSSPNGRTSTAANSTRAGTHTATGHYSVRRISASCRRTLS